MSDPKGKELQPSEGGDDVSPIDDGDKKGKKKLIIILVPVILLLGGGAAAYFTGMLDKVLGKTEVAAESAEKAKAEHGEEKKAEGEDGCKEEAGGGHEAAPAKAEKGKEGETAGSAGPCGVAFLKVPDMVVNLNSDTGEQRYLRLSIQLELASTEDMAEVQKVLPRVVDQFQTYLRELRLADLRGSKGIYRLQMELLSRVNQAAAPVQVKDVLFQEILIQ